MSLDLLHTGISDFWFGAESLRDAWRIYLYGGLLVFALSSRLHQRPSGDSPLQAPEIVGNCPAALYEPAGLFRLLPRYVYDRRLLSILRFVVLLTWIASLLGFGGIFATAATGVGLLWLHGALSGALGTNHRWMLPLAVLFVAGFADMRGPLSLDSFLSARMSGYPFPVSAEPFLSSAVVARTALVAGVLTLFAGGVSKLRLGGKRWADGESLRFHIGAAAGASPRLKQWITGHAFLPRTLAVATLAVELLAPFALVSSRMRIVIFSGALVLHAGIWLTMKPNYLPQAWCYALALAPATQFAATNSQQQIVIAYVLTGGTAIYATMALRGTEWWPFTSIPMYAFYRGPEGTWSQATIRDEEQAIELSREFIRSALPFPLGWSASWISIHYSDQRGTREIRPAGVQEKHWRRLLHRAAAFHWSGRQDAAAFLNASSAVISAELIADELSSTGGAINLVATIGERRVMLASATVTIVDPS